MWIIQRLKSLGGNEADHIRTISGNECFQLGVPAWTTMLTKAGARNIEAIEARNLEIVHLCCQVQVVHLAVKGSQDEDAS